MRRTGKYWLLTIVAAGSSLLGAILISFWDQEKTSDIELWLDITFNGLGFASTLTSTLIVSGSLPSYPEALIFSLKAIIACVSREDMAVATGRR